MAAKDPQISEKIEKFFILAIQFFGKEVGLSSAQCFCISQISVPEKEREGEYSYVIQYGYTQTGAVILHFRYSQSENEYSLDKINIYAPPQEEEMVLANFSLQSQIGSISIREKFGMGTKTQEHKSTIEIKENPNATAVLDIAISDLSHAQILGECSIAVPIGSTLIPCCHGRQVSIEKEKKSL